MRIEAGESLSEAYPILCSLADRIQLQDTNFNRAAVDVLNKFRRLLQGLGRLTEAEEIGLFGELLFLVRLVQDSDGGSAVSCWTGADHEEHDFAVGGNDVEVKTTSAERRSHRVHGLNQLVANPGRALWLLSVQLTAAGPTERTLGDQNGILRAPPGGCRRRPGPRAEARSTGLGRRAGGVVLAEVRTAGSATGLSGEREVSVHYTLASCGFRGFGGEDQPGELSVDLTGLRFEESPPFPVDTFGEGD